MADDRQLPTLSELAGLSNYRASDMVDLLRWLQIAALPSRFQPGTVPGQNAYQPGFMADYIPRGTATMPGGGLITGGSGPPSNIFNGPLLSEAPDAIRRMAFR